MTNKQMALCNGIIHSASLAAAAAVGTTAQIPLSDRFVITPIQLAMAVSLGQVFGISLDQSSIKAGGSSAVAESVGKATAKVLCSRIPGIGNIINAGTAFTVTEGIGWIMAREFDAQSALESA